MYLWDLLRILVAGILLGLLVGKLAAENPWHFQRLSPRYWRRVWRKMTEKERLRVLNFGLWTAAGAVLVAAGVNALLAEVGISILDPQKYPLISLQEHYPLLLLIIVNVLPIFEEWIFRGIIIDELMTRRWNQWKAVLISAILFSLFHLSNPGTYLAFSLAILPAGILLGWCYLKAGLGGAILAHDLYNTFLVILNVI